MRASAIVVANELLEDHFQVPLGDWDEVVGALAAKRADYSFTKRIG